MGRQFGYTGLLVTLGIVIGLSMFGSAIEHPTAVDRIADAVGLFVDIFWIACVYDLVVDGWLHRKGRES